MGDATGPTLRAAGLVEASTLKLSGARRATGNFVCRAAVGFPSSSSSEVSAFIRAFLVRRLGDAAKLVGRLLENFPGSGGCLTLLTNL